MAAGIPPRMIVAVETISEANIKVSPTLPNKRAGERICDMNEREQQPGLVEQAVDDPEEGDADIVEVAIHDAAQFALGTAPSSRNR